MGKVLVIDDSAMVRIQVSRTLQEAGFATLEARDGAEGLDRVRENADVMLAICDVNMPKMSGLEFLEEVRKLAPSVAVVMLTTEGQPSMVQRARELGARGWIIKPFKQETLIATAKRLAA